MLNSIPQSAPIAPINEDLRIFVNDVLALHAAGKLAEALTPVAVPAPPIVRKSAMPTLPTDHAFIRLVAAEIALMDTGAFDDIFDVTADGYFVNSTIDSVPTIADVNERYALMANYARSVKGLEFGRNSANYREAQRIIAA